MNIFTDTLFIFVYVFVLLHFGIININIDFDNSDIITPKIYMFLAVTVFSSMLYLLKYIRGQCPINVWNIVSNSLILGMLAYIGHTMMFDFLHMKQTAAGKWLASSKDSRYFTMNIMLSLFVSLSILIGKSFVNVFSTESC